MVGNVIDSGDLQCPNCGELMQPMKTKDKYKCNVCKMKVEQLSIFSFEKTPKRGNAIEKRESE